MKDLVEKIAKLGQAISEEKGPFQLFALFLREDAPDKWDLIVAAPWIEHDKAKAVTYIAHKAQKALTKTELVKLSRIVAIDKGNPALDVLHRMFHLEYGLAEIKDCNFFGLQIKHAYVIVSSRRGNAVSGPPAHEEKS